MKTNEERMTTRVDRGLLRLINWHWGKPVSRSWTVEASGRPDIALVVRMAEILPNQTRAAIERLITRDQVVAAKLDLLDLTVIRMIEQLQWSVAGTEKGNQ